MRKLLILLVFLFVVSCGANKNTSEVNKNSASFKLYEDINNTVYYIRDSKANLCFVLFDGYYSGGIIEIDCNKISGLYFRDEI